MNIKDQVLHNNISTVMVPKYSPLPYLENGRYRYLMACNGLWIEAVQPWGIFRQQLWESPKVLVYGEVDPLLHLEGGLIPHELLENCIANASEKADEKKEWAGCITYKQMTGHYSLLPRSDIIVESKYRVSYNIPKLPTDEHLVLDLHSHPFDMPAFSQQDDEDDKGGVRLAGVISFGKNEKPKLTLRLCLEGHFFEVDKELCIEA